MPDFDIIAIGGGAGGLVTAAGAAGLGARTALIERHKMGGECLWTGCVPSKALLAAARSVALARDSAKFGIEFEAPRIDFRRVMAHVHHAQHAIEPNDSPDRFRSLGVEVISGTARFVDRKVLSVNGRELTARHFVIATGSRPAIPDVPGLDRITYHTNETIFEIETLPASLVVLGGGAVGIELAQAFALLGSHVTVLEADTRVLRAEDEEITDALLAGLQRDGVMIRVGTKITSVESTANGVRVHTSGGVVDAESLLIAAGRRANTDTLDLDDAGVAYHENGLRLDKYLRTSVHNIWGVGDVTGAPRFTHIADYQARLVLRNALFPFRSAADYTVVPWAIYTHPEIAHVGLTEKQARDRHGDGIQVWRKSFVELDRAIADGQTNGLVKIITDERGQILGGHILGTHASSMIAEIVLAMKRGIRLADLAAVIHAYPTYPESVKHTADAFVRSRFRGIAKRAAGWLVRR
jgi:pyruvate/2-oxoglutarate dehydrogenase complex dihydrolipoamide dehydrogenase (E3) component